MAGEPAYERGYQSAAALRFREELGLGAISIWELLEQVGLQVAIHPFGEDSGDGLYLWDGQRGLVVVNADHRPARQRFTAAHELGHHEMHRHGQAQLAIVDQDVFGSDEDREKEANAFAAFLMAPDAALARALEGKSGDQITPQDVVSLMRSFGLSYEALTWRLLNAGLTNKAQAEALRSDAQVEARMRLAGFSEDEIFPPAARLPRQHIENALRLYRDHVITTARLGELLDMDTEAAIEFAGSRVERPPEPEQDQAAVDALLADL